MGGLNGKVANLKKKLKSQEAALSTASNEASADKEKHAQLATQLKKASTITLPSGIGTPEAHKILDEKEARVSKTSAAIKVMLQKTKKAIAKRNKLKKEEKKTAQQAVVLKEKLQGAKADATAAEGKAKETEKTAEASKEKAKAAVTAEKTEAKK